MLGAVEEAFRFGFPTDVQGAMILELSGREAEVLEDGERARRILREAGAREVRAARDDAERQELWKCRKKAFGAVGRLTPSYVTMDVVVPLGRLPELVRRIQEIKTEHGVDISTAFHAGDGNLHPGVHYDDRDPASARRAHAAADAIIRAALALDGSVTGEHGVGIEKRHALPPDGHRPGGHQPGPVAGGGPPAGPDPARRGASPGSRGHPGAGGGHHRGRSGAPPRAGPRRAGPGHGAGFSAGALGADAGRPPFPLRRPGVQECGRVRSAAGPLRRGRRLWPAAGGHVPVAAPQPGRAFPARPLPRAGPDSAARPGSGSAGGPAPQPGIARDPVVGWPQRGTGDLAGGAGPALGSAAGGGSLPLIAGGRSGRGAWHCPGGRVGFPADARLRARLGLGVAGLDAAASLRAGRPASSPCRTLDMAERPGGFLGARSRAPDRGGLARGPSFCRGLFHPGTRTGTGGAPGPTESVTRYFRGGRGGRWLIPIPRSSVRTRTLSRTASAAAPAKAPAPAASLSICWSTAAASAARIPGRWGDPRAWCCAIWIRRFCYGRWPGRGRAHGLCCGACWARAGGRSWKMPAAGARAGAACWAPCP
ncbi:hypothetical protein CSA17_02860 [bacterium DOLJORAL78_65_58]|nr:MAG: hypothetical protein CSA17_02860 [bacterium DOLJORAL78_65_58]